MTARSYLYVPADRPDMMEKALGRGADAIILDLEDAVAPESKEMARKNAAGWLDTLTDVGTEIWVRINPDHLMLDDIHAIVRPSVTGVVLAKATPGNLVIIDDAIGDEEVTRSMQLGSVAVNPLVETAAGLVTVNELAKGPRVSHLAMGEADLRADLRIEASPDEIELLHPRMEVVVSSAAANLGPPVAALTTDFKDLDALRKSSERLRRLGFGSRSALHPAQIPVINEVFSPSAEEVAEARAIVDAYEAALTEGKGASVGPDGKMLDEAVVRSARWILELAER